MEQCGNYIKSEHVGILANESCQRSVRSAKLGYFKHDRLKRIPTQCGHHPLQ
jgi:hypothetical protein